jgi:TonB family protein
MASHHLTSPPETDPRSSQGAKAPEPKEPLTQKIAVLISVLVHGFAMLFFGLSALLAPHKASTVPIFEIVSLEKPKLRPLRPKVQKPPEPPPPEPEPVRPPDAPKLTPTPSKAVQPKKPEPKVVKEVEDRTEPVKEVIQEEQVLQPQVAMNMPQDPRLSLWAARVKKKVDQLWNPPNGIDVMGKVKVVVTFKVARDGAILSVSISEASGNTVLDDLALMTIKRLENVPPIPENFPNDELEVGCEFPYQGQ